MSVWKRLGVLSDTSGGRKRQRAFANGWPATTSAEIKFHVTHSVQFRYRERLGPGADAPTIVFCADPPVTLEAYDELLQVFASRFRVIVFELPAMGFSATTSAFKFQFRETNDEIAHFIRAVAGEGAILAFSCAAGLAAVDIAAREPALASRLVLFQTGDVAAFQRWKALRDPKGVLARPILGQIMMRRLAPSRMPAWFDLSVGNRSRIDPFCACVSESFSHGALWSLASAYQVYLDPTERLAEPAQPILSIWGRADRSHPRENEASALNFSAAVDAVAFDDLGHFPELEDPARIFKIISARC